MSGAPRPLGRALLLDVAVVIGWFLLAGALAAVLWWLLASPAEYLRTPDGISMSEVELGDQVSVDGWYFVLATVGGLVSGFVLPLLRQRDLLVTVVLVGLGALLAGWLMTRIGLWLGPPDPRSVAEDAALGEGIPFQLELRAPGMLFAWPVAALAGALGLLWGMEGRRRHDDTPHQSVAAEPDDRVRPDRG